MSEPSSLAPGSPAESRRPHPAVVAAMVFGWLLLAAGAFIAVAYVLGWLPKAAPALPATTADEKKPAATARTQAGVVLLPGETLVETPDAKGPAAPAAPPPPGAAPAPRATPPTMRKPPAPAKPSYARPAAKPAPRSPREEAGGGEARSICLNCATVTSIQPRGDAWEVFVRFDDGSREVIRYYDPPRLRVGDAVHLEDGRLIPD